jgi:CIC family chloride channel protein
VLLLGFLSCVAGTATGLVVALFRMALQRADAWRSVWIARAHDWTIPGLLLTMTATAALAALAAWLVERFSPHAAGSGIPRVEAVAKGNWLPHPSAFCP